MSMVVGGVNFPLSNIELEQRVIVLEQVLERILNNNAVGLDIESIREDAFKDLQKKYPDLGLSKG